MKNRFSSLVCLVALPLSLLLPSAARAIDYTQTGATGFPIQPLPGNPVLTMGDRLLGSVSASQIVTGQKFPTQYLTFLGSGLTGLDLDRYTFTIDAGSYDNLAVLFDTKTFDPATQGKLPYPFKFTGVQPFVLGYGVAEDWPDGTARIVFDQFDTTGADQTFGFGFTIDTTRVPAAAYNYALSWERTSVPVNDLGVLNNGDNFSLFDNLTPGAGTWYSFTLNQATLVHFDTKGSPVSDTALALFNSFGSTINFNDDVATNDPSSRIENVLSAGTYYLSVGLAQADANWRSAPYDDNPGRQRGWSRDGFSGGAFSNGGFLVNITATVTAPEPGTLAMLGLGLGVLFLRQGRRRNRQDMRPGCRTNL